MAPAATMVPQLPVAVLAAVQLVACSADTRGKHTASHNGSTASAVLVERTFQKPPRVALTFDFQLHNGSAEERWFVFPVSLAQTPGGVDSVQVYGLGGSARLVQFLGTGGFQAVRVPGKAQVIVGGVVVKARLADGGTPSLLFDVLVAKSITVGGKSTDVWASKDHRLPSTGTARVAELLASDELRPDHDEVTATLDIQERIAITVPDPGRTR